MSEHTKEQDWTEEPWGETGGKGNYGYMDAADGDRAVACVNALAGIPTKALEDGAIKGLVEALKEIEDGEPPVDYMMDGYPLAREWARKIAINALAALKPEEITQPEQPNE